MDDGNWVEAEVEVEGLRASRDSSPFPVTENVIKMPGSCDSVWNVSHTFRSTGQKGCLGQG